MDLQAIYLNKISEAIARLGACDSFLSAHRVSNDVYSLEAAVLQARKALEAVAFAAIAPNKTEYEAFRAAAEEPADYRKDFNARAILKYLGNINKDFYPTPLLSPRKQADGSWHFERRPEGVLTKKQFESFYDRLGKYLHADNPWGGDKGMQNLVADLPSVIKQLRVLLEWHFTVIRTPEFMACGLWKYLRAVPLHGSFSARQRVSSSFNEKTANLPMNPPANSGASLAVGRRVIGVV